MDPTNLIILFIAVALLFDFLNGFHDSANIVATMIASGAMGPRTALVVASVAEFSGPFLFGVAVAATIGTEILDPKVISLGILLAALCSAIIWDLATWYFGIPSSSSHALIGGMLGAAIAGGHLDLVHAAGMEKVLIALFISPLLGIAVGWLLMRMLLFMGRRSSPRINTVFKRGQIFTSIGLALSHGTNDAQKTMGVITSALVILGFEKSFSVPWWVIALCAGAISLGISTGGWRIIKTLGAGMYRIRPIHGFAAQATSASIILGAALLGGPVSSTQVVSSAIMGVGSAERISKVRWGVAQNILVAWVVTIPASIILAGLLYMLISPVIH
ncbi:MAG: inorganic phosphate transporter [Chloroflexota bacterium]|nr:inorganic phosphate transporter [Chloroflexota bacterium]